MSMHYACVGDGAPVLMLPGALGTGAGDFHAQIGWFADRHFRVVAPDPRGYGQSRPPKRTFPTNFYYRDAVDMFALMSALGHDRYAILGWSDGANIGTIMAAQHPERVSRLAVFGGNAFLTRIEIAAFDAIRKIETWQPRAAQAMREIYGEELDRLWADYVDGLETIYAMGGDLYKSLLPKVLCPTLILNGSKDPLVPPVHSELIHRRIAGSRLHVFADGKHNIHTKFADEFNTIVFDFLRAKES